MSLDELKNRMKKFDESDVAKKYKLEHRCASDETCVKCQIINDYDGNIVAVLHTYMKDEAQTLIDSKGQQVVVQGIKSKLNQGKVKVKNDFEVEVS